ncbi:MAG: hypothetical protein AAF851_02280 [Myxococcota bacterium]
MAKSLSAGTFVVPLLLAGLLRLWAFPPSSAPEELLDAPAFESPGVEAMGVLSVGHAEGVAALMWLRTIQFIGTNDQDRLKLLGPVINSMAQLTTDTDPRAFTVYWATATVLTAYVEAAEDSNRLLDKAIASLGLRWEFLALQAYNAFFLQRDPDRAATLYARAAQLPRAPRFLSSLAGRARTMARGPDAAIQMLKALIPTLPEGPQLEHALDRLELARREKLLMAYDEACTSWLHQHAELPPDPETLNREGMIQAPSEDSFGHRIQFERYRKEGPRAGSCVARTNEVERRDFEVAAELLSAGGDE